MTQSRGEYAVGVAPVAEPSGAAGMVKRAAADLIDVIDSLPGDRPETGSYIETLKEQAIANAMTASLLATRAATAPNPTRDHE